MAGSLNKVILVGNLGRDPEVRTMQSGDKVATLSLATSDRWKDKEGVQQERTEWHRVVLFGKLAEICEQYLHKGSKVLVEGRLQTRKWTDQNTNTERYSTEVVVSGFNGNMTMLDTRGGGGGGGSRDSYPDNGGGGGGGGGFNDAPQGGGEQDGFEDDIPF